MNFDFVEIGTADFESLTMTYPSAVGLSVEPMKVYLDRLPNNPYQIKLNAALVPQLTYDSFAKNGIECFWVDEQIIKLHGLGEWMKGCNSINGPHDFHTHYYHDAGIWHDHPNRSELPTRNLMDEGLVSRAHVRAITWKQLMLQYSIGSIHLLKTDTEGMDAILLQDILDYYWKNHRMGDLPKTIQFEDNAHTDKEQMNKTKELLRAALYTVDDSHSRGHDSYAVRQND